MENQSKRKKKENMLQFRNKIQKKVIVLKKKQHKQTVV